MSDKRENEMMDTAIDEAVELSDEMLDDIAGGFVYHDRGDADAHRKEAYYVIDDGGNIVMRVDDVSKAKHWAENLRVNQRMITAKEFEQLRKNH